MMNYKKKLGLLEKLGLPEDENYKRNFLSAIIFMLVVMTAMVIAYNYENLTATIKGEIKTQRIISLKNDSFAIALVRNRTEILYSFKVDEPSKRRWDFYQISPENIKIIKKDTIPTFAKKYKKKGFFEILSQFPKSIRDAENIMIIPKNTQIIEIEESQWDSLYFLSRDEKLKAESNKIKEDFEQKP